MAKIDALTFFFVVIVIKIVANYGVVYGLHMSANLVSLPGGFQQAFYQTVCLEGFHCAVVSNRHGGAASPCWKLFLYCFVFCCDNTFDQAVILLDSFFIVAS